MLKFNRPYYQVNVMAYDVDPYGPELALNSNPRFHSTIKREALRYAEKLIKKDPLVYIIDIQKVSEDYRLLVPCVKHYDGRLKTAVQSWEKQ